MKQTRAAASSAPPMMKIGAGLNVGMLEARSAAAWLATGGDEDATGTAFEISSAGGDRLRADGRTALRAGNRGAGSLRLRPGLGGGIVRGRHPDDRSRRGTGTRYTGAGGWTGAGA